MTRHYPHLQPYQRPDHFADWADFDRTAYYVVASKHRDSDTLTRANFDAILRIAGGERSAWPALRAEDEDETPIVLVVRDSHFAVGWAEAIYVHRTLTDEATLTRLDETLRRLADYPVVDEDAWAVLEWDEAAEVWASWTVRDRVHACQRYGVSVFAARRAEVPEDPTGELVGYLADGR